MLKNLIQNKKARVGVIGLGYVGLPLAVEIAKVDSALLALTLTKNVLEKSTVVFL